jgi:hypothetical protein
MSHNQSHLVSILSCFVSFGLAVVPIDKEAPNGYFTSWAGRHQASRQGGRQENKRKKQRNNTLKNIS